MPSRYSTTNCSHWVSGFPVTIARRWAKCCARCCRWRPRSVPARIYSLTDAGRDASRQMSIQPDAEDTVNQVIAMLAARPLSAAYHQEEDSAGGPHPEIARAQGLDCRRRRVSRTAIRCARRRQSCASRSPAPSLPGKLPKAERELLAYLALHPGIAQSGRSRSIGPQRQPGRAFAGAQTTGHADAGADGDPQRARARPARPERLAAQRVRPDRRRHRTAQILHVPAARRDRVRARPRYISTPSTRAGPAAAR